MNKEELKKLLSTERKEKKKNDLVDKKWIIFIIFISFIISFLMSFISQEAIPNIPIIIGIVLTLLFIFLGVIFDIIGVAVTSSDEKVFHSMNAKKVKGANIAVLFKKNAEKVSSFTCDVIGDICGIVSGACGTNISLAISHSYNYSLLITSMVVGAIIASLTIGGKAIGKGIAINKSNIILYNSARIVSIFYKG